MDVYLGRYRKNTRCFEEKDQLGDPVGNSKPALEETDKVFGDF